jgi:hypothetical protein
VEGRKLDISHTNERTLLSRNSGSETVAAGGIPALWLPGYTCNGFA